MAYILPKDDTSNRFMDQFLDLLSEPIPESRLVHYETKTANNDLQIRVRYRPSPCESSPQLPFAVAHRKAVLMLVPIPAPSPLFFFCWHTLEQVHKLHVVEWEAVTSKDGVPTHMLAPASVLRRVRREFTRCVFFELFFHAAKL